MSASLITPLETFRFGAEVMFYIIDTWSRQLSLLSGNPSQERGYVPQPLDQRVINFYGMNGKFTSREDTSSAVTPARVWQGLEYLSEELTSFLGQKNAPRIKRAIRRAFPVFNQDTQLENL